MVQDFLHPPETIEIEFCRILATKCLGPCFVNDCSLTLSLMPALRECGTHPVAVSCSLARYKSRKYIDYGEEVPFEVQLLAPCLSTIKTRLYGALLMHLAGRPSSRLPRSGTGGPHVKRMLASLEFPTKDNFDVCRWAS